ncbi:MAG: succinate dehydrogenase cytochrome b subunit [Nitrospirae bacterium]|nr:succinate dehydrogenase cytochrome b subunit [Nitrospirota bacterium]
MGFIKNTVGRKVVIAVTGQLMVVFIIFHLPGNYFNPWAMTFPAIGSFIWIVRLALLLSFVLHAFFGIQSELENHKARSGPYAVTKSLSTTFAAKTMIWSGILSGVFIIFHLLNITVSVIDESFQDNYAVAIGYAIGLSAVCLHLYHGIASFFQTMGWNSEKSLPAVTSIGKGMALLLFGGFICIVILNRG